MLNPWTFRREGFDEAKAAPEESLFSLGNGYIGWRGNYEEGYSRPMGVEGCYLNGFHETEKIRYGEIAYGYAEESQTMLNVTGSQRVLVEAGGVPLYPDQALRTARTLRMREGILKRETVYAIPGGTLTVRAERLVSFDHPHTAAIRVTLMADAPCDVALTPLLSGDVTNLVCTDDPRVGSGLHGRVLSLPVMGSAGGACGMAQHTGHTRLALACAMACRADGLEAAPVEQSATELRQRFTARLAPGQAVTLEKTVAYFSGAADAEAQWLASALAEADASAALGFERLKAEQAAYMARFWHQSGIWVEGDDELLQGLRFNMYHLLQSAGRDGQTNIAAKGLTGEGYEGHYFWDTETYIFPMFLHVAPEVARALLAYRYSILPQARARAREMGHPVGALFPWRTINGREASAYYPAGTAQAHIDADIALAVKRYWEATGDDDFLADMGAEIVCETARFYLDLGFYNPRKGGKFCINEVTGPDEYNALVDNNAYTNLMAATNLTFAADALAYLRAHRPGQYDALAAKIGLKDGEAEAWRQAAAAMYIPRDEKTGLIWQDDGFMDRKPWPLEDIPKENFPLLLHYHPLVIYRHQVCKQADTVLAMLLLPWRFTQAEMATAFDYYDRVTTHDSSLSMAAFSAVASRIGERDKAYRYFRETARLDLDDTHGNTRDGLHMANMAGTWVCVTAGFGGMQVTAEGVSFAPILPDKLKGYGFRATVRGRLIEVRVDARGAHCALVEGEPMTIRLNGEEITLRKAAERKKEAFSMKYAGIIFDLDGVICSTDHYHYLAWKALADRLGIPFNETDNNRLRGVSRMESLNIVLEKSAATYTEEEKAAMATEKNDAYRQLLHQMSPADLSQEVKETLDTLRARGLKLAIGSSSKNTPFILERLGLGGYFDAVADGNCITHSKPDPEVFLKAAEMISLDPDVCLVVEDAHAGVEAAAAGGFDCAAIGDAKDDERARWHLNTFADLLVCAE